VLEAFRIEIWEVHLVILSLALFVLMIRHREVGYAYDGTLFDNVGSVERLDFSATKSLIRSLVFK
jgi:hypothetical protein